MDSLIPSSFLPHLSRQQNTLSPLTAITVLSHVSLLKELYIPPIHGGFNINDLNTVSGYGSDEDGESSHLRQRSSDKAKARKRRFSASLADTMDGLGLGLDVNEGIGAQGRLGAAVTIQEEDGSELEDEDENATIEENGEPAAHLDPFEREWAEKWLNGVVRRAQGWSEEHEEVEGEVEGESEEFSHKDIEAILRDATAVLAMMAGTSAAGSLTRHLLFPVHSTLEAGIRELNRSVPPNPALSPSTQTFLASLATSPVSPIIPFLRQGASSSVADNTEQSSHNRHSSSSPINDLSSSPEAESSTAFQRKQARRGARKRRVAAVPVLLHDAPMSDHLSVGVQTWGSAILLGRRFALHPADYGLFPGPNTPADRGVRVLDLGAGTGLMSILCRKLLDLRMASDVIPQPKFPGLVVATDFLPNVIDNLRVCVDLNFPPHIEQDGHAKAVSIGSNVASDPGGLETGMEIAKLDWTTYPKYMSDRQGGTSTKEQEEGEEMSRFATEPFDLVIASDCVYDPTHAKMLREVASWTLRLPDKAREGDIGGTFHILSPIRPTFTPELESIDANFPPSATYTPLEERQKEGTRGEGLGAPRSLKLGTRGEGKRSVKGRKGEGRVDEVAGYWWWEVGWA